MAGISQVFGISAKHKFSSFVISSIIIKIYSAQVDSKIRLDITSYYCIKTTTYYDSWHMIGNKYLHIRGLLQRQAWILYDNNIEIISPILKLRLCSYRIARLGAYTLIYQWVSLIKSTVDRLRKNSGSSRWYKAANHLYRGGENSSYVSADSRLNQERKYTFSGRLDNNAVHLYCGNGVLRGWFAIPKSISNTALMEILNQV